MNERTVGFSVGLMLLRIYVITSVKNYSNGSSVDFYPDLACIESEVETPIFGRRKTKVYCNGGGFHLPRLKNSAVILLLNGLFKNA